MSYRDNLIAAAKAAATKNPDRREEIIELVHLFDAEVESGESEVNEYELALRDIKEIAA